MIKTVNSAKNKLLGGGGLWSFMTLFIVSMLFYADAALADQASDAARGTLESIISAPINYSGSKPELAHKYFADIFGSFIFLPWGAGSADQVTVLARAVGFTNILALFLGVVILYYVMIGGALQTAHQGEVLGKAWSTVWIPMRATLGFGLIMPAAGVGGGVISVAQIFIIWLIVMGSNAATYLWDKTVDNIGMGTPIAAPTYTTGITPTKDIFKMLVCTDAYIRGKTLNKSASTASDIVVLDITDQNGNKTSVYASNYDSELGSYRSRADGLGGAIRSAKAQKIDFAFSGACGSIDLGDSDVYSTSALKINEDDVFLGKQRIEALDAAREVIANTIDGLAPLALKFRTNEVNAIGIQQAISDGDTQNPMYAVYEGVVPEFGRISESYAVNLVTSMHSKLSGSSAAAEWSEKIKNGGWIKAGTWFHEIGNYSGESIKAISEINNSISFANANVCSQSGTDPEICKMKTADMNASVKLAEKVAASYIGSKTDKGSISQVDKISAACSDIDSCSISADTFTSSHRYIARSIISLLAFDSNATSTIGLTNPFETVTSIGHVLNNAAMTAWAAGAIISSATGATEQLGSSVWAKGAEFVTGGLSAVGLGALKGLGGYLTTSLLGLIIPLATTGFVLAYMLPFLPVVTWINMVSGYLLTVVEATIAAPLAVIMMVTPEGEGISGTRLERAMQLLAMAILKPSLMIIGLVTAITLSYVSFGILNLFFFESAAVSLKGDLLDFIAIIIIYCTTALSLCKLNVSIIHKLSDQILEWFSSGVGRQFGESEVSGGMEHSIQNMKTGSSSIAQSIAGRIGDKRRMRLQQEERGKQ
ncbi:hypothetical protein D3C87_351660 [compost metagenome]